MRTRITNAALLVLVVVGEAAQNERGHIHENAERVENGVLHDDTVVDVNK